MTTKSKNITTQFNTLKKIIKDNVVLKHTAFFNHIKIIILIILLLKNIKIKT